MFRLQEGLATRSNIIMLKGQKVLGHAHNFWHLTGVGAGGLAIRELNDDAVFFEYVDDLGVTQRELIKPATVRLETHVWAGTLLQSDYPIPAGVWHELEALADKTIYHCRYLHRDWHGLPTEKFDGYMEAYG